MRKFGLIGYPLTHSFSEKYFSEKFEKEEIADCNYSLFPLENIQDVRFLFEVEKDLHGLNVTIPFKETVIEYLDDLDETAQKIGAVNCIKIDEIQKVGYNTDYSAFRDSLKPLLKQQHKKALILGTGGASKAVNYALQELNVQPVFVSRNKSENNFTYTELNGDIISEFPVIINCTPTGMYPDTNVAPEIPYHLLSKNNLLFDLIYNPEKSLFLQQGEKQGCSIKNGLEMLQLQAEYAWKIWNTDQE